MAPPHIPSISKMGMIYWRIMPMWELIMWINFKMSKFLKLSKLCKCKKILSLQSNQEEGLINN